MGVTARGGYKILDLQGIRLKRDDTQVYIKGSREQAQGAENKPVFVYNLNDEGSIMCPTLISDVWYNSETDSYALSYQLENKLLTLTIRPNDYVSLSMEVINI